jgi:hypothetical protein
MLENMRNEQGPTGINKTRFFNALITARGPSILWGVDSRSVGLRLALLQLPVSEEGITPAGPDKLRSICPLIEGVAIASLLRLWGLRNNCLYTGED